MQDVEPILVRAGTATILAGLAGLLLSATGVNMGAVAFNSTMFAAAVIYCGSVVVGQHALLKISAALSAQMRILAVIGYGITLAVDGVGNWMGPWFITVMLAVTIMLRPAVLARLNLRRVLA